MIRLLVLCETQSGVATESLFGGLPVAPRSVQFRWPRCKSCDKAMQFLGRVMIPEVAPSKARFVLLFMCQNNPGLCDEWDAESGGNKAIIVSAENVVAIESPSDGITVRETQYGVVLEDAVFQTYDEAREGWSLLTGRSRRHVLGQMFGTPSWVQADETPSCNCCRSPMRFIAQLEQGPDSKNEMNFGGGCAYLFDCVRCDDSAKFLWQCSDVRGYRHRRRRDTVDGGMSLKRFSASSMSRFGVACANAPPVDRTKANTAKAVAASSMKWPDSSQNPWCRFKDSADQRPFQRLWLLSSQARLRRRRGSLAGMPDFCNT